MKILMLLENDYEKDLRVKRAVQALYEAGFEVIVAAISLFEQFPPEKRDNCTIYKKKISSFVYKTSVGALKIPIYFNFWRKYIREILKVHKIDVIHINDLPLSRIGIEIKNKHQAKLVIDLHENWPALLKYAPHTQTIIGRLVSSNEQWTRYEKDMLHEADLIITIVEEARDRIESLGIGTEKLCIVSNTVDTETIPSYNRKRTDKNFILFYGGGINRHRGLQIVLEAIKILKDRNVKIKLQVAGSGSFKVVLEKQAVRLGIESDVRFYGFKPFNEMLELLSEADAAIIPHLRNENNDSSSPNKLYQYMYLKIPVISSDCLSLKRILSETDAGFVYRNDSPDDLASLLEKLNSNRQLLAGKGLNGRKAVFAKYNWNFDKEHLVKAYSQIKTGLII